MRLLLRWLISAITVLLVAQYLPGFEVTNFYFALIAALVLGLLNATIRPVLLLLTLPINVITLGLFSFFVNAALIWFAASFLDGFTVTNFWSAVIAAVIFWAVGVLTNELIQKNKKNRS
jgi:putative membrane protein